MQKLSIILMFYASLAGACDKDDACIKSLQPHIKDSYWNQAQLGFYRDKIKEEKEVTATEKKGTAILILGCAAAILILSGKYYNQ